MAENRRGTAKKRLTCANPCRNLRFMGTSKRWLTATEAAEQLQVTPDWIRRQCVARVLPAKRIGRSWRIAQSSLDAFMSSAVAAPSTRLRMTRSQDRQAAGARRRGLSAP